MGLRIMAVTDGRPTSAGALNLAGSLGAREGVSVRVLAMLQPLPVPEGVAAGLPHVEEVEEARANELLERVTRQLSDAPTPPQGWRTAVAPGSYGEALEIAADRRADLLIMARNGCERTIGCSTEILALARASRVPVVLAGPDAGGLPRRAVVGVDFGPTTTSLVRAAAALLAEPGTLRVAHILPRLEFPAASLWGWTDSYVAALPTQFRRVREAIGERKGLEILETVLEGEPVGSLLQVAADDDAQLLALGSVAYTYRERISYCGVPAELARRFSGDVLLVPPRSAPPPLRRSGRATSAKEASRHAA